MTEKQIIDTVKTARHPNRLVSIPAIGITINAPIPRHKNSKPRVPSLTATLAFTLGVIVAHAALVKPEAKNITLVALASIGSTRVVCDKLLGILTLIPLVPIGFLPDPV